MNPGSYGTKDVYTTGFNAQQKLSLPVHRLNDAPPDAMYTVTVDLSKYRVSAPSEVQPKTYPFNGGTVTRPGGGTEVTFINGTGHGSVSEPVEIPQY